MISVGFVSNYNKEDLTKLSVISESESFIYGLFDNDNTLMESGRKNLNEYDSLINAYPNLNKFHLSKSNSFMNSTHRLDCPISSFDFLRNVSAE